MQKISFLLLAAIAFTSCNTGGTATTDATKDSASSTAGGPMNYPYTIDHPDNWNIGSNANTMIALSALKAFENGDVAGSMKYFGDSVHLQFDALDKKLPADSMQAMLIAQRASYKSLEIKMNDWESVISKDKEEEWVTLWYREKWEDMRGNKDSLDVIDDLKIKDGKIIRLGEFSRKLH